MSDKHAVPSELGPIARIANAPFVGFIRLYQLTLRPVMGRQCRFSPTCSDYGLEAYRLHGPIRGTRLTVWRILRCQPFCKCGYDPVPIPGISPDPSGEPKKAPSLADR
ncbi:MAG: membrane protein insertion efficiency factor YidD [Planctomycetota bacterium]